MMLGSKKIAGLLTVAALLAACGGGGGGDDETSLPSTGGAPSTDNGAPSTGGDTSQPPANDSQNPGTQNPDTQQPDNGGGEQVTDTRLQGRLSIVANQLVFLKADRSIYNAIQLEEFETGGGLLDAATGSTGTETAPVVQPSATAPAAPIAALGFRIDRHVQATTEESNVASQTAVGRLALNLVEIDGSTGIHAGEVAEQLSFVLDGVELSTDANGELTGVRVKDGAQIHVHGRTAAGNEISESLPASAQSVRLLSVSEVLDNYGDTSSTVLLFDLEHAFAQAGSRLAGLELLSGHFNMDLTLSAATIVRPAGDGGLPERVLTGKEITVNSQPKVTGTGVSGTAWIRAYP